MPRTSSSLPGGPESRVSARARTRRIHLRDDRHRQPEQLRVDDRLGHWRDGQRDRHRRLLSIVGLIGFVVGHKHVPTNPA